MQSGKITLVSSLHMTKAILQDDTLFHNWTMFPFKYNILSTKHKPSWKNKKEKQNGEWHTLLKPAYLNYITKIHRNNITIKSLK